MPVEQIIEAICFVQRDKLAKLTVDRRTRNRLLVTSRFWSIKYCRSGVVQWTANSFRAFVEHMGVDHGGFDVFVAK